MLKKILFLPLRKQRKNKMENNKKKMQPAKKAAPKNKSTKSSGLTPAQKKLPPFLQKAIAKRSSSKKK
jgi:hypothetical protein